KLRANEVKADVTVTEAEPVLTAEPADGLERVPGLVRAPPAALLVCDTGERVEDAVEVGRDVEAEHLYVVPHVSYDGCVVSFDYSHDAAQEPRSTHAPREDGRLHAASRARSVVRTLRVRGPSRPRSRSRSAATSTSSMRFGASTRLDGPSAAKRSALPGP